MTTVRQAAQLIASRCDGAVSEDGQGFNKFDSTFVKGMLHRERWTAKMERAIQKTLIKYKGQLSRSGIGHSELIRETTDETTPVNSGKQMIELNHDERGRLLIKSPYSFKEQAKAIPHARWDAERKMWCYLPRVEVYVALLPHLKDIQIQNSDTQKILDELEVKWREVQKDLATYDKNVKKAYDIKRAEDIEVDVPLKTTLMVHQKKAFAIGVTLDAVAFLMEQGTGKTLAAIAVGGHRYLHHEIHRLVVVAPLSVVPVWQSEFDKHADFSFNIVQAQTKDIKKAGKIADLFEDTPGLQVLVINYESLWRIEKQLQAWAPQMAVLDESQKIKNGRASQSKAAHKLGTWCKYRLILTGTPVTQSPMDIHSQYRFLNKKVFGDAFIKFRDEYAIMGGYMGYEVTGYKDLHKMSSLAHSIAYRVTKEEALDLPPMTDQILYCELKESAQAYRQMEKYMIATVSGDKVTAPIVLTQLLRMQQITGGFLPIKDEVTEETVRVESVGHEKLGLLKELVEDMPRGKKLVIFARFIPEIKAIQGILTQLNIPSNALTGATDRKQRGKMVERFQEDGGGVQALVIQIQTGGLGITLTAADTAIFYSTSFSYADYEQARARIHRIGQKQPVTYIHLIAKGTIDEDVLTALREKKNVADLVVDKLNPLKGDNMNNFEEVKETVDTLDKELSVKSSLTQPKKNAMTPNMKKAKEKLKNKQAAKSAKSEKKPAKKPIVQKSVNENLTHLSTIAKECKVDPAELRKALRGSKIKKPGGSWAWPKNHADIKEVKKLAAGLE